MSKLEAEEGGFENCQTAMLKQVHGRRFISQVEVFKTVRRLLFGTIVISGMMLPGISTFAQDRDRDRDRDRDQEGRYTDRDQYHRDARDQGWWRNRLFDRVREDI